MRGPRRRDPEGLGDDHAPLRLHAVDVPGDSMSRGGGALVVSHSARRGRRVAVYGGCPAACGRAVCVLRAAGRAGKWAAPPVRCGIGRGLSKLLGPRRVGGESLAAEGFLELYALANFLLVSYRASSRSRVGFSLRSPTREGFINFFRIETSHLTDATAGAEKI